MTIKVLSVNGRRMPKAIYTQLPRRSLLAEDDCSVQGRAWGIVLEQKCCHGGLGRGHWHVLHEIDGELAIWNVPKRVQDAEANLRPGAPYEPRSHAGTDFLDACGLETHLGGNDFFQGKVFDLIRDGEVAATVEDVKVLLPCSAELQDLREARKQRASVAGGHSTLWPTAASQRYDAHIERAETKLRAHYQQRGKDARELYTDLVTDVRLTKQARVNYSAALDMIAQLPQLFLGA
ncbi:hypothetical protein AB0E08_08840 [Streptomyces sp. NPDC048281]|uniref:hypothetical protein n=1 Tax=Streptomyces sp. NPDC048281 TaxID=3154715 RepID=UPI0034130D48